MSKPVNSMGARMTERLKQMSSKESALGAVCGAAAGVAMYVSGGVVEKTLGMLIGAVAGGGLGLWALMRLNSEITVLRMLESNASQQRLSNMNHGDFVLFVRNLYQAMNYTLTDAPTELRKRGMADFIAAQKKQRLLVQLGHWDDAQVDLREIQALFNVATTMSEISEVCVISLGVFSQDTVQWSERRNIRLIGPGDLLSMAAEVLEVDVASLCHEDPDEVAEQRLELQHEVVDMAHGQRRYLFVDFAGIRDGYALLESVMTQHPAYDIIATTLADGEDLVRVAERLPGIAARMRAELPVSGQGRYFDIQTFLDSRPMGRQTPWVVLESAPKQFPEGCTELVAINSSMPFDHHAATRLNDALLSVDRIAARLREQSAVGS